MNLFYKLKKFIMSILKPQKQLTEGKKHEDTAVKVDNYIDSLQNNTKNDLQKKEILKEVDKNPNLIDTLSYKRLKQLNQIYEERINELELKLKMLKNNQL